MNREIDESILFLSPHFLKQREYWNNKLSGETGKTAFFSPLPLSPAQWGRREAVEIALPETVCRGLLKLSKGLDLSLYVVLLTALKILLYRYTARENSMGDIVITTPVYRPNTTEETINRYVYIKDCLEGKDTFRDAVLKVRQSVLDGFGNQDYPVEKLLEFLAISPSPGLTPSSDTSFVPDPFSDVVCMLDNIHDREQAYLEKGKVVFLFSRQSDGGEGDEQGYRLKGHISYETGNFEKSFFQQAAGHFVGLLEKFLTDMDLTIAAVPLLSEAEKRQILEEFNGPTARDWEVSSFMRLFEGQVERRPDYIALVGWEHPGFEKREEYDGTSRGKDQIKNREVQLTYNELNRRANRLSSFLAEKGPLQGKQIGILLERSPLMVESILAVWKAGAVYVPLDGGNPTERIQYMLENSGARLLLSDAPLVKKHSFADLQGYRMGEVNVERTAPRESITVLDELAVPDRSLVDYEKYSRHIGQAMVGSSITLQASRGCPYQCAYCHKIWPKRHVVRSAQHIFAEVKRYYDIGFRRFVFIDDIFNLDRENSAAFFREIIRRGMNRDIQIYFPNGFRGDILTKDYIDLVIEAGTRCICLALETASPRLQELIRKNLHIEKFRENIQYICQTYPDILLELFTMLGFPTESEEEAMMTLDFIKSLEWIDFPYINILTIYSNTEMEEIALANGISRESIFNSEDQSLNEFFYTLPLSRNFTLKYQTDFLSEYFLSRERLLKVLPRQMKILTENELVRKYNSYLPGEINTFPQLLQFLGIKKEELGAAQFVDESSVIIPHENEKIRNLFPTHKPNEDALRVLLLDLSQYFSGNKKMLYDVVETPLGLMYLLTTLNKRLGRRVQGKIAKSRMDFDSFADLKRLMTDFKPDVIGIRSLTFYRDFFHETVGKIRQWGFKGVIISGGPYATSCYEKILQDLHVDLVVLGEGEVTFGHLVEKILANNCKLPDETILREIPGIAFLPGKEKVRQEFAREIVLVDEIAGELASRPMENPVTQDRPAELAYIIYTSGSTGTPKGAMVEHAGMINHMAAKIKDLDISHSSVIAQNSPHTFDISIWQFFAALACGGKTVIYPDSLILDPAEFIPRLARDNVTILEVVPSYLSALLEHFTVSPITLNALTALLVTGETIKLPLVKGWFKIYPFIKMVNVYGPTEASDDITHYFMTKAPQREPIPIGKPIANLRIYILDTDSNLSPVGVPGEIVVSGIGIGRGYIGDREKTREVFTEDPFIKKKGVRMYRTGDLGAWLPDGNIDFYGRKDHQVKIRGYRIELGEIEACLLWFPGAAEAAVVIRQDAQLNNCLCAYMTAAPGVTLDIKKVKDFLKGRLPGYMVPGYIFQLAALPLTKNGKIHRDALPTPEEMRLQDTYRAPRNLMEENMAATWTEVLGVKKIGIEDNFFQLGGDSIKAIQLSARLQKHGMNIKIGDLFLYPTIRELLTLAPVDGQAAPIPQEAIEGEVPLLPIQQSFFEKQLTHRHHYNQAVMIFSEQGFAEEIVRPVFGRLVEHHDMLRAVFRQNMDHDPVIQSISAPGEPLFDLVVQELLDRANIPGGPAVEIEKTAEQLQCGIDLEKGPLVKVGLFKTPTGDYLLVVIHHLVIEGVSWRILFDDFQTAYQQVKNGQPIQLPAKTDSFKRWADGLREYAQDGALKHLEYWKKLEETPVDQIPGDYTLAPHLKKNKYGEQLTISLDENLTGMLLKQTAQAYGTEPGELMITALGMAVKAWCGAQRIPVTLEGHGREEIIDGVVITRTVGWFAVEFPVILDLTEVDSVPGAIKTVKEMLRRIPNKGIDYGILKYLSPREKIKGMDFKLEPRVCYNYLGQLDAQAEQAEQAGQDAGSFFSLSSMNKGRNISPEAEFPAGITVDTEISGGTLNFSLEYNRCEYNRENMEKLVQHYLYYLEAIIRHCAGKKDKELTPVDLGYTDLTIGELEEIISDIEDID